MPALPRAALIALLLSSPFIPAGAGEPLFADKLVGEYRMDGAPEAASGLVLGKDGRFKWMLAFGDVYLAAHGTWQVQNDKLVLTALDDAPMKFSLVPEADMAPPPEGSWTVRIKPALQGDWPQVEVRFDSAAGRSALALTDARGYASTRMPAAERWTRVGLRRAGTGGEWQWTAVPAAQADARSALFAVANPHEARPPFASLRLALWEGKLEIEDGNTDLRGAYVRL